MSEIINVFIGKAGVRIGEKFVNLMAQQHDLGQQQTRGDPQIFFAQQEKTFQTRSLYIDMHPGPIQELNLNPLHYKLNKNNIFSGTGLNSDLFAVNKYHEGCEIAQKAFENVRKQVEKCDKLSGFVLMNSIAGGTGSGLGSQMLTNLRDQYCDRMVQNYFIVPQIKNHCSPTHVYNSVLSIHYFIEQTDFCIMAQNEAFSKRLTRQGNVRPAMDQINQVHAQNLTQITASYRFPGTLNTNQRKIATNLLPFPRLKFLVSSFSSSDSRCEYLSSAFQPRNFSKTNLFTSTSFSVNAGDIFTMQVNVRDRFAYEAQVHHQVHQWLSDSKLNFPDWTGGNYHISINQPACSQPSASILINSRHVVKIFEEWANAHAVLFRRKAFLHHYTSQGMDEMEFTQAESNLNDLVSQHTPYENYEGDMQFWQEDQAPQ